jgi:superfamily II DNA or RNA helicase
VPFDLDTPKVLNDLLAQARTHAAPQAPVALGELVVQAQTRPQPVRVPFAQAMPQAQMSPAQATAWVAGAMRSLAALPPPGPQWAGLKDDQGFSAATNVPGRNYVATIDTLGVEEVPFHAHLGAAELLRVHQTQVGPQAWRAAYEALRAVSPVDPKMARGYLRLRPGSTAARGQAKDGTWVVQGARDKRWVRLKPARKHRGPKLSTRALQAAGFVRNTDFWWVKEGGEFFLMVAPGSVPAMAAYMKGRNPALAEALELFGADYAAIAAQQAPVAAPPAPPALPADPALLAVQHIAGQRYEPAQGRVGRLTWRWDSARPKVVALQGADQDTSEVMRDAASNRPAFERTPSGRRYWREYETSPQTLGKVHAALLGAGYRAEAAVIMALTPAWSARRQVSPQQKAYRQRKAKQLVRRFQYMLHPTLKADPARVEAVLGEVVDLVTEVEPGAMDVDLGPWGRFRMLKLDENGMPTRVRIYAPWEQRNWYERMPRRVAGGRDGFGYYRSLPMKHLPMAARALDLSLPPLAMALRIAWLSDQQLRECPELEELAMAPSIEDVADPTVVAKMRTALSSIRLPAGLQPYPYQLVGAAYVHFANYRSLIGDAMGLGKTIQAILTLLMDTAKLTPALVVAPSSVIYNWRNEIQKWAPGLRVQVLTSKTEPQGRRGTVDIVSWDVMKNRVETLLATGYRYVIYDESQMAKNPKAARSVAAASLAHQAPHVLLLSGTPMENRPKELWHQLYMISPRDFSEPKEFLTRFASMTKRTVKTPRGVVTFIDDRGHSNLDELRDLLRCYMVRRIVSDVFKDIPPLTREYVTLPLPPQSMRAYRKVEDEFQTWFCARWRERAIRAALKLVEGGASPAAAVREVNEAGPDAALVAEMKMMQLGQLKSLVGRLKAPLAAQWIVENLPQMGALVVFVENLDVLKTIGGVLDKKKIKWSFVDGSVTGRKRQQRVEAFQRGDVDVIIGTMAMHAGVTLTRAHHELFVQRWWVPAREEQAEYRIHRVPYEHPSVIHYLMAPDTVDEHIAALVDQKRAVIEAVMRGELVDAEEVSGDLAQAQEVSLSHAVAQRVFRTLAKKGLCKITVKHLSGVQGSSAVAFPRLSLQRLIGAARRR